jgi:hypothetical protein
MPARHAAAAQQASPPFLFPGRLLLTWKLGAGREEDRVAKNLKGSPLALAPQQVSFFAQKGRPPPPHPLSLCAHDMQRPPKDSWRWCSPGKDPHESTSLMVCFLQRNQMRKQLLFYFALSRNDRLPLSLCARGVCSCPPVLSSALHSGFSTCTSTVPVELLLF